MKYSLKELSIAYHLCVVALALIVCAGVYHYSNDAVTTELYNAIETQEARMLTIAELTDRNSADSETKKIINDCPRRSDYEHYLVRLATLTKLELITMQNLFDACAPFYVEQKSLMVSRFAREFESYNAYITLLSQLEDVILHEQTKVQFARLLEIEEKRSELVTEQTEVQEAIITQLITGKTALSTDVKLLLEQARQIGEMLSVLNTQADDVRMKMSQ